MFEGLRDANENMSALAFMAMSFAALFVLAGLVHPGLIGLGPASPEVTKPAPAPKNTVPATSPKPNG